MYYVSIYGMCIYTVCYCCLVSKSCLTLCGPMDWNPSGSSVHGILQARILGCHSFFQGIFLTQGSNSGLLHCRQILYHSVTREAHIYSIYIYMCVCVCVCVYTVFATLGKKCYTNFYIIKHPLIVA